MDLDCWSICRIMWGRLENSSLKFFIKGHSFVKKICKVWQKRNVLKSEL
ncbi:unnamed protein product [Larinioides sclopetarius]|uniref:Uncharacterized protein n=1 Tax=Larinioides sclopetarius TaxID=280406 RepID=A0AAV2AEA0_9ARAC